MTEPAAEKDQAADRLRGYLERECLNWSVEVPEPDQVAAVLHALADHTAIMAALRYRRDDTSPWPEATSLGRWFHDVADAYVRTDPPGGSQT